MTASLFGVIVEAGESKDLDPSVLQTIADGLSVLVAVGALIVAFLVERRNQECFEDELRQFRELAQADIKPLLTISSQVYTDLKSVRLINGGIGTAVITKALFSRGKRKTTDLVELFQIDGQFKWETLRRLSADRVYVSANETIELVKLSE